MKRALKKKWLRSIVLAICAWLILVAGWHMIKPLPDGINYNSTPVASEVELLYDLTYEADGIIHEQAIFDTIFDQIDSANDYILIDMFLFNPHLGKADSAYRGLSGELVQKLIIKKKLSPDIKIDFITDPINLAYGGDESDQIKELRENGVNVIFSDLTKLRDSNPVYSTVWRTFLQWFGNSEKYGLFPHPFASDDKVTLRSYLRLVNFKANHRKTFIADDGDSWVAIVMSANPHDGSSAHSNIAIKMRGGVVEHLFLSEKAVAIMSNEQLQIDRIVTRPSQGTNTAILTEKSIRDEIIKGLNQADTGDEVWMAMFYLADRKVIKALLAASKRGADVYLILDPNKDSFGYEKNGVPNRPVAYELVKKSKGRIKVRWYDTHGEQFHTKLVYIKSNRVIIILGSANLTKRNLGNLNLETDVMVHTDKNSNVSIAVDEYLNRIWNNQNGHYTLDFEEYKDKSLFRKAMYRFQEWSGLCSF